MPRGPEGEKRPADVNAGAVMMRESLKREQAHKFSFAN